MDYTQHDYGASELAYKEFLRPSLQLAVDILQIRENDKILDAGCGPGSMFPYFADKLKQGGQIIGIDASDAHLHIASQIIASDKLEKLIRLIKTDLFNELPLENNYFDWIWLSDVLFPDDFGDQIDNTIKKLHNKLKPGGKIAIFYGNWLRLELLPGYSLLEHSISILNEKRKSTVFNWIPELHPENALAWLTRSGFNHCRNHYVNSYYQAPLADNIKSYIHYHLTYIYLKAIEFRDADFKIPDILRRTFDNITDSNAADYILDKENYHCAVHAQLTIGEKP